MPTNCTSGQCSFPTGGYPIPPYGVAISDSGIVYIAGGGFLKLDTTSGTFTEYGITADGDADLRDAISSDNTHVFFNDSGQSFSVDTATDSILSPSISLGYDGDYDLSLSSNQTRFTAGSYLYDSNLNLQSYLTLNDREIANISYVYGVKLSPDGTLVFQPSTAGIDVFDGRIGTLRTRIALPFALSQNYDALVSDGKDNVLVAIIDTTGDGIAVIDLSSLSEPAPLPYASEKTSTSDDWRRDTAHAPGARSLQNDKPSPAPLAVPLSRVPHATRSTLLRRRPEIVVFGSESTPGS